MYASVHSSLTNPEPRGKSSQYGAKYVDGDSPAPPR